MRCLLAAPILVVGLLAGGMRTAVGQPASERESRQSICLMVESAARANGLPAEFFARVIWQESRFNADAIGPLTRSGKRAQGIAQFMPGTAADRELLDPFDPVQALPKAAEFLSQLRSEFGNLGLAAAAYNAGPRRVHEWLDGTGTMPAETRHYVAAITGHTVEDWKNSQAAPSSFKSTDCETLVARLDKAPNMFLTALEQRVQQAAKHPWGVQLAASFSRAQALTVYARAMKRFEAVLSGRDPLILHHLLRSRGTRPIYQVRVGADSRSEAERLCSRIQAVGGACLVLRNG